MESQSLKDTVAEVKSIAGDKLIGITESHGAGGYSYYLRIAGVGVGEVRISDHGVGPGRSRDYALMITVNDWYATNCPNLIKGQLNQLRRWLAQAVKS